LLLEDINSIKKSRTTSPTFTLVAVGSPAFRESFWIRNFLSHPYEWFGFSIGQPASGIPFFSLSPFLR